MLPDITCPPPPPPPLEHAAAETMNARIVAEVGGEHRVARYKHIGQLMGLAVFVNHGCSRVITHAAAADLVVVEWWYHSRSSPCLSCPRLLQDRLPPFGA